MTQQKGSTALNIVLVLAVLAIVAALAIPAYYNHVIRGRVSQALKVADAAKLVVLESATTRGGVARITAEDAQFNAAAVKDPYVASVTVGDGGRITVITRDTGSSPDPVLLLTPIEAPSAQKPGPITWACSVLTGDSRMAPRECTALPPTPAVPATAAAAASV